MKYLFQQYSPLYLPGVELTSSIEIFPEFPRVPEKITLNASELVSSACAYVQSFAVTKNRF